MTIEVKIAPTNSLLLIMDRDSGQIPESICSLVSSTPSCLAVCTLSGVDGETTVMLSDQKEHMEINSDLHRTFTGKLATPRKEVHICTVALQILAKLAVPKDEIDVELWINHDTEPSKVWVLIKS